MTTIRNIGPDRNRSVRVDVSTNKPEVIFDLHSPLSCNNLGLDVATEIRDALTAAIDEIEARKSPETIRLREIAAHASFGRPYAEISTPVGRRLVERNAENLRKSGLV